jgi:GNAT superfamily N-acetyltransferase
MVPAMQCSPAIASEPRTEALSKRWLGVDFRALLPWKLGPLTIEHGTVDELLPFVTRHYATLFGSVGDRRWRNESITEPKLHFLEEADIFLIRSEGHTVGDLVAHPSDWSTYYLRSLALLPEHRGLATAPLLFKRLAPILADAGVERIEADVSPVDTMNVLAQTRLGFVATGTCNTDRWGALVRMTKFLHADAESVFNRQFCAGTWHRSRHDNSPGPEGRLP